MNSKYTFIRRIAGVIFSLAVIILLGGNTGLAAEAEKAAGALNSLGLFSGSDLGYELERTPTRGEALVMLLRLTGQEDAAEAQHWTHPFQDGGWADAYIGYAYQQGLTSGTSAVTFGTGEDTTARQYAAFLLRALGYKDFAYEKSLSLLQANSPAVLPEGARFTRGDMANMSLAALGAPMADGSGTLAARLADKGVLDWSGYQAARDSIGAASPAKTTILIYMVGGDLEPKWGDATADIREIMEADLGEDTHVVLQAGGTKTWENDWMTDGGMQRFTFEDGTLVPAGPLLEGVQMSEPKTLANFLRWGVTAYPAQQYILVFWNHGGGTLYGYGCDELNGKKWLSLGELHQALTWADVQFKLVGFDACLMATMSTAYMLRSHADYLLASEELEPAKGWRYTKWVTQLSLDPDMEMEELAKWIAQDYLDEALEEDWPSATISLIDLDRIEPVVDAWRDVSAELVQQLGKGRYDAIEQALLDSRQYGMETAYDQVDLVDFMTHLESLDVGSAKTMEKAVAEAVVYCASTPETDPSTGLALYVPYTKYTRYPGKVRTSLLASGYDEGDLVFWDAFYAAVKEHGPKKIVWPK